jgi:hypothetical protein
MAEFKLGRIRLVWQGDWSTSTTYVVDDVVRVGGNSYICVRNHTASALFETDLNFNPTYWNLVAAGLEWRGDWATSTYYNSGDQVKYGGVVYICTDAHTSASTTASGLEADQGKWDTLAASLFWRQDWAIGTRYRVNDLIVYGGNTYVCNLAHTSAATLASGLEADQGKWDEFNQGFVYLGVWQSDTPGPAVRYRVNDIVKYGAGTWICTTAHTSATSFDGTKWETFVEGLQFEDSWSVSSVYQEGDVVTYGGYSYIAKQNHVGQNPSTATAYWDVYTTGFNFSGDWSSVTDYRVGDVIRVGGYTYVAILDSLNQIPPNVTYWSKLNSGLRWSNPTVAYTAVASTTLVGSGTSATFDVTRSGTRYAVVINNGGSSYVVGNTLKILGTAVGGLSPVNDIILTVDTAASGVITDVTHLGNSVTWTTSTVYVTGDLVFWGASTYICVDSHTAGSGNRPDNDATGTYWNLLASGTESSILTTQGDTYFYGENGPARLPLGEDGTLLRSRNGYPEWAYYGVINNIVYVAPTGTDSTTSGWGLTIDKPWASVRFACEQIEKGYWNRNAVYNLARNKQFIMKEITNWVIYTYTVNISSSSSVTNEFTCNDTTNLSANMPIKFSGTVGGVTAGTEYYVKTIIDSTHFTISNTAGGVTRTLTSATANMTGTLSYDQTFCERDVGLLVDAVIYDLGHGGNEECTKAAKAYYTVSGSSYINANFGQQTVQTIAAYNYLKVLTAAVINNATDSSNYQAANDVPLIDRAEPIIDPSIVAEANSAERAQTLLTTVTDGISAGIVSAIPTATFSNTTISVKTGTFYEILPMVVPKNTAVVGDELRSTVISPQPAIANLASDRPKTISALTRIKSLASDLVQNITITPTTGNTATQDTSLPDGSVGSSVAASRVIRSTTVIYDVLNNGLTATPTELLTNPTNWGTTLIDTAYATTGNTTGDTTGYNNARVQLANNYAFIKADVSKYIENNYSAVWTGLGATGQAKCQRDIGYILDAIRYDTTYGGNTQSLIAGSAYYSGLDLTIPSDTLVATLAAYTHLKSIITTVAQRLSVTPQSGNVTSQSLSGTGGPAVSGTFAQDRVQNVIDWITTGVSGTTIVPATSWVDASLLAGFNELQTRKSEIQSDGPAYVKKFFQSLSFDEDLCARDIGYMVDAIGYDVMFNSNFASTIVGASYHRALSSTAIVLGLQKDASLGLIKFLKYKIKVLATGGGAYQISTVIDDIVGTMNGGATPRFAWPDYTGVDAQDFSAAKVIWENSEFLQAETLQYITTNYPSIEYSQTACARDVGFIIDALRYDMTYGGNFASKQAGIAYYSRLTDALQIDAADKTATLAAYANLKTALQDIANGGLSAYTPLQVGTAYNGTPVGFVGDAASATRVGALMDVITNIIDTGLTTGVPRITITVIAGGNTFTAGTHGLSAGDEVIAQSTANGLVSGTTYYVISAGLTSTQFRLAATYNGVELTTFTNGTGLSIAVEVTILPGTSWVTANLVNQNTLLSSNKLSIQNKVTTYITTNYPNLVYNSATCARDVGYIIDSIRYDLMMNSNYRSVRAGTSYYQSQASLVLSDQKRATLQAFRYMKKEIADVIDNNPAAEAYVRKMVSIIIDIIDKGVGETPEVNGTLSYMNNIGIINSAEILRNNSTFLENEATAWIRSQFGGTVVSTSSTTDEFTTSASHRLTVGDPVLFTSNEITTLIEEVSNATTNVTVRSTAGVVPNMRFVVTGTGLGSLTAGVYYIQAVIDSTNVRVSTSVGGAAINPGTATGLSGVVIGGAWGGITYDVQYYVLSTPTTTTFTIGTEVDATTPVALTTDSGVMSAEYAFEEAACKRDMREYINAVIYDLNFAGNYKSTRSAVLYNHAVKGSEMSDMFLVSNASGLRNCTLRGLEGDLSDENEYGTKRPTAGAYVALNPGFGPNDSKVWVSTRSHYSQNVTMFGFGCSGAKIDSSLHAGGNKSMVKNDFTTILGDGIGVWCTGADSLTELVSVFAYFSYAGYIAELGGRIRATNGNSSYGSYGVIAEGVDSQEIPLYANLNNRAAQAQITNTVTDGVMQVLRLEYGNAGTNYTNTQPTINGSGFNAAAIGDEFRDGAIFETRVIDLDNGDDVGGTNYVNAANSAQTGDTTSITIAATDQALSAAYLGMRIQITAGTGVGQYANILTYQTGSKIATVYKDSFTTLTATNTTTSTNLITVASTASLYAGMPIYFTGTTFGGITANTLYYVRTSGLTATQFTVSTTGAAGTVVTLSTAAGSMSMLAAGWDHIIPGTAIVSALDLTTTYSIEPRISYSAPGYTATARTLYTTASWTDLTYGDNKYVAIASGPSTTTAFSANGTTWANAGAMPASANWSDVVYGGGEGATATIIVGGIGGRGAILQAVLGVPNTTGAATEDQVASVTIIDGGEGFATPPVIVFTPVSGGSGAVATCTVLNGAIATITITVPGSGYNAVPTTGFAIDRVTDIVVNSWGRNYFSAPSVTIDDPFSGTAWSSGGAVTDGDIIYFTNTTVTPNRKNWYEITVTGTLTTTGPTHTSGSVSNGTATLLYIGTTAVATPSLTNTGVSSFAINYTGQGYTSVPNITILDTSARYVAIAAGTTNNAYTTRTGIAGTSAWTAGTAMPAADFASVAYGNGIYVVVGGTASAASSVTGSLWSTRTIPTIGAGTYSHVTFGNGTFVAISTGNVATAVSSNGTSWSAGGNLPTSSTWNDAVYGNGRFVAIATGTRNVAISYDKGTTWVLSASQLPSAATWTKIRYGHGLFFAVSSGGSVAATSPDGINWTQRAMPSSSNWNSVIFGNINKRPLWVAISNTSGTVAASVRTGAQALGRVKAASGVVTEVRMVDPGSGYPYGTVSATAVTTNLITVDNTVNMVDGQPVEFYGISAGGLVEENTYYVIGSTITSTQFKVSATQFSATPVALETATIAGMVYRTAPVFTVTDPNQVQSAAFRARPGDGALGNPSFSDRGADNATATSDTVGDGYSDLFQVSTFVNMYGLSVAPTAGANVEFASIPGEYYKLVTVTNLVEDLDNLGTYKATFQINPALTTLNAPRHGDRITTRLKYSQVRLTGHDFLYIGTGNQTQTNYPNVDISTAIQANQALFTNGGRVFFTSTDQDGNFNVGNLFGVQQATGTATLNASAFNLSGLNSLQLGSIELGIDSAIITQFSTDPFFTADSDNVVPTQRAIRAYITAQIGGGQSSLNVNTLTSGVVYIAGNSISTTTGEGINITSKMNFTGGIDGSPVALAFFMQR